MEASTDEIADGIYRLSVLVPEMMPGGFTFNSFVVLGDEPLLFHAGQRAMFPLFSAALARVMPVERLRWISFGHVEADECGAMNLWLAAAPDAQVVHGHTGCMVSLNDLADRPPRAVGDGELITGAIRFFDTPHVPHGWESGLIHDEASGTLFCGDLFTQGGDRTMTTGDLLPGAIAAEELFHATSIGPATEPTLRRLAALAPRRLALMHGPSFVGDGAAALNALADHYAALLAREAVPAN